MEMERHWGSLSLFYSMTRTKIFSISHPLPTSAYFVNFSRWQFCISKATEVKIDEGNLYKIF